eukprot:TRINITY_DN2884_c0_g1_i1.p1 TRINITY_DN2884_c0_g1~~TRINITY_DN2884_c0_g1_i1.p1  ORF type:complete len:289 (+),score=29.62 TRINITY_DN2884_c0_g1_i1:317-1183(+)
MGHPRVEVQPLIQRLSEIMGRERGTLYWDGLRRFLLAKLSKREFDHIVMQQLGVEHIGLHNNLIQGILVNAQSGRPAPTTPLSIFTRTEHKKRPRVMLKQKKDSLRVKGHHRDYRPQNEGRKHSLSLTPEDRKERGRKKRMLGKSDSVLRESSFSDDRKRDRNKGTGVLKMPLHNNVRTHTSMRPRHTYTGMIDLEPPEVAYEVRQHVASIGMNVTQEGVDYVRYAAQEYVNRLIDACRTVQDEDPDQRDGVIRLHDLNRAVEELRPSLPPWSISKLFERSLTQHSGA